MSSRILWEHSAYPRPPTTAAGWQWRLSGHHATTWISWQMTSTSKSVGRTSALRYTVVGCPFLVPDVREEPHKRAWSHGEEGRLVCTMGARASGGESGASQDYRGGARQVVFATT